MVGQVRTACGNWWTWKVRGPRMCYVSLLFGSLPVCVFPSCWFPWCAAGRRHVAMVSSRLVARPVVGGAVHGDCSISSACDGLPLGAVIPKGLGKAYMPVVVVVRGNLLGQMFSSLGRRESGTLSPWSVFNPNFEVVEGTLTASQLDRQFRHQYAHERTPAQQDDGAAEEDECVLLLPCPTLGGELVPRHIHRLVFATNCEGCYSPQGAP